MAIRSKAPGRAGDPRPSLRAAFDTPEAKRRYNARLFATIADRYDLITRLLSYGRDQSWTRRLIGLAGIEPGETTLDLACGTGDLGVAAAARGARVVGLDLVPRMIARARERPGAALVSFIVGDMTRLPVATCSVDVVTTGYGLRNVPNLEGALDEIARVLRPGGRLLALDFNRPANAALRAAYLAYLTIAGATAGLVFHGDPDTYRYIPASLARYPGAAAVVDLLRARGFDEAQWIPVLGGLMAIHVARRGA
jgi:demethylmenaquinone methyltransferase/2-methoxy-6-polyprenyl-1,4-benzoquinol methylase